MASARLPCNSSIASSRVHSFLYAVNKRLRTIKCVPETGQIKFITEVQKSKGKHISNCKQIAVAIASACEMQSNMQHQEQER